MSSFGREIVTEFARRIAPFVLLIGLLIAFGFFIGGWYVGKYL